MGQDLRSRLGELANKEPYKALVDALVEMDERIEQLEGLKTAKAEGKAEDRKRERAKE